MMANELHYIGKYLTECTQSSLVDYVHFYYITVPTGPTLLLLACVLRSLFNSRQHSNARY